MTKHETVEGLVKAVSVQNGGILLKIDDAEQWYNTKDFNLTHNLKGAKIRLLNVVDGKDFESLEIIELPSEEQQKINQSTTTKSDALILTHYEKIVARFLSTCKIQDFEVFKQNLKEKTKELKEYIRGD